MSLYLLGDLQLHKIWCNESVYVFYDAVSHFQSVATLLGF